MICVEYEIYKDLFNDSLRLYNRILREQEELFAITQPKSMKYDSEKVQSTPSNLVEKYLQLKEEKKIDERLAETKAMLKEREILLKNKKIELMESKNIHDLIYRYKFIDEIKVSHIAEMMGYSTSQVYRILDEIKKKTKDATKCENFCVKM